MKKVLIASTALALVAGAASAEVAVTGIGLMGVTYGDFDLDGDTEAAFSQRIRVYFKGTGETDGGLTFGFEVRNDQSGVGFEANGDSTVFVSGAFGKLVMGDTGNAGDILVGQLSSVGYTELETASAVGKPNEIDWTSRDQTGAYYEYSTGPLTLGVGSGQLIDTDASAASDDFWSAAVKYSMGDYAVAVSYEDNALETRWSALGSAKFGPATIKVKAVDSDLPGSDTAVGASVDYTVGALTVTAFGIQNQDLFGNDTSGLGAAYDLGGGAVLKAGIADDGTNTVGDVGVVLTF